MTPVEELLSVMRRLRDPDTGCAWDIKQSFASIAPYTIEEAYEVADAIEREDLADLQDELGDLLLQVVFHAQMADEQKAFGFDDVAQGIVEKLVRRHPHIFSDVKADSAEAVKANWDKIKQQERAAKPVREDTSAFAGVARALPALMRAQKIQERAAEVGFDWQELDPVWDKINEEISELHAAVDAKDKAAVEDELGDVLFSVVNLARHLKIDPETAMTKANSKFEKRFREVEHLAQAQQSEMNTMSLQELDALWDKAKQS